MRIAFCAHDYPPVVGGMEIATHEIARRLQGQGHDVRVFVARTPMGSAGAETIDCVSVTRLIPEFMFEQEAPLFSRLHKYITRVVRQFTHILTALLRWKPDILHISITPDLVLCGLAISRILRTPIVVSAYGSDLRGLSEQSWYRKLIARLILARADYVITVSRDLGAIAKQLVPSVTMRHETIPSGVDYEFFENERRVVPISVPYILAIGAMKYVKGHDVLLRGFALVHGRCPDYHLILAGDGKLYDQTVGLARELDIQELVHFWGVVDRGELAQLLWGCELLVMASRSEGMPLSILEAFACGKAVVATRVGGVGEIVVDGETGILVEPERDRELAEGIIALLRDPERRTRMGNRAREVAKEYDWDRITQSYARVFMNITGVTGRGCTAPIRSHSGS